MLRKNDGYLLLESLLAMLALTVGILFMCETIVFIRYEQEKSQNDLELAIFAKEWQYATTQKDKEALRKKAEKEKIVIIDGSDQQIVLKKNGRVLDISRDG